MNERTPDFIDGEGDGWYMASNGRYSMNPDEKDAFATLQSVIGRFGATPVDQIVSSETTSTESPIRTGIGEVRSVDPDTGAEKGTKPERFDLIPADAMADVARHYGIGARKYADNNWRRGYNWSLSIAALERHLNAFKAGIDIDPETNSPHMAAVAFHALALLTFMREHPEKDDRYTTTYGTNHG